MVRDNSLEEAMANETMTAPFDRSEAVSLAHSVADGLYGICPRCDEHLLTLANAVLSNAVLAMDEERGRDARDAARYRWLKANHLQTGADSWYRTGDDLEEALDAEISKPSATEEPKP